MSKYVLRYQKEHLGVEIVPVCPEQLGGLPTPRPAVKCVKGRIYETCPEKERRHAVTGKEVTEAFQRGAEATLALAKDHGCPLAILCRSSPSCARNGMTGRLLVASGIEVLNAF